MTVAEAKKLFAYKKEPAKKLNISKDVECNIPEGIYIYGYKGDNTEVVIPDKIGDIAVVGLSNDIGYDFNGVKKITFEGSIMQICEHTFHHNTCLEEIVFPEGLVYIGVSAFEESHLRGTIKFPDSLRQVSYKAFSGCLDLECVELKNTQIIMPEAFSWCRNLRCVKFPSQLICLGGEAFAGCDALEKLQMPEHCEFVGKEVFAGCESLNLPEADGIVYFSDWIICSSGVYKKDIYIKGSTYGIAEGSFVGSNIRHLNCSYSLKYIGISAFESCHNLKEVHLSGCEEIDNFAFYDCVNLEEVQFSENNLCKIGAHSFDNCKKLSSPVIGNKTDVGTEAFKGCKFNKLHIYKDCRIHYQSFAGTHIGSLMLHVKRFDGFVLTGVSVEKLYIPDDTECFNMQNVDAEITLDNYENM